MIKQRSFLGIAVAAATASLVCYLLGALIWLWLIGTDVFPERLFDGTNSTLFPAMRLGVFAFVAIPLGILLGQVSSPSRIGWLTALVAAFGLLFLSLHLAYERTRNPRLLAWSDLPVIAWPELVALCILLPLASAVTANHVLQRSAKAAAE